MPHSMSGPVGARCLVMCTAAVFVLAISGCKPEASEQPLRVVVTVAPLAGLVDRVAPDLAQVTVMIPPGASPVTYEPSLSRVRAASSADLYVSVGHPAFTWESTWLVAFLERSDAPLISSAEDCDVLPDDPHVWLSIRCARDVAGRIAGAIAEARPGFADSVQRSYRAFLAEVDALAEHAERVLEPHKGGSFVVLHPAWGYLARDYGLQQVAILDHGSGDAGPAVLMAMVRRARELGIENVIAQPQFSAGAARLVASELGGRTVELDPLARDWTVAMLSAIDVLAREVRP